MARALCSTPQVPFMEPAGLHLPRVIRRVFRELNRLRHTVIKFPVTAKQVRVAQRDFFAIAGFPQVVGAVDGTHIGIHRCTYGPDEYSFINRKNRHSTNVQLICDGKFRITNVVARWPGSTHDSRILHFCFVQLLFDIHTHFHFIILYFVPIFISSRERRISKSKRSCSLPAMLRRIEWAYSAKLAIVQKS